MSDISTAAPAVMKTTPAYTINNKLLLTIVSVTVLNIRKYNSSSSLKTFTYGY